MSILDLVPQDEISCASDVRLCSEGEISKWMKGARQEKAGSRGHTHINVRSSIFGTVSKLGATLMFSNGRINEKGVIVTQSAAS